MHPPEVADSTTNSGPARLGGACWYSPSISKDIWAELPWIGVQEVSLEVPCSCCRGSQSVFWINLLSARVLCKALLYVLISQPSSDLVEYVLLWRLRADGQPPHVLAAAAMMDMRRFGNQNPSSQGPHSTCGRETRAP